MNLKAFLAAATVVTPRVEKDDVLSEFLGQVAQVCWYPPGRPWNEEDGILRNLRCRYRLADDDRPGELLINDELLLAVGLTPDHVFWLFNDGSNWGSLVLVVARRSDGRQVGWWTAPEGDGWVGKMEWNRGSDQDEVEVLPDHEALIARVQSFLVV